VNSLPELTLLLRKKKEIEVYDILENEVKRIYKCIYRNAAAKLEIYMEKPPAKITIVW